VRLVMLFGPEPWQWDSGSVALGGGGWVVELGGRTAGCTHRLEKSDASFMNTSIHRLSYWQVNIRKVGASSLKERSSE
jgi:hypothetical protein